MEPKKKNKDKPKKRKTLKIILTAVITLLVLLAVALLVIVPAYISSESGRKTILTKINESVTGSTDFASLSMSWFKGVKLTSFTYDDDFGQTSVRVKQISTKPHYASILAGNLSFGKTVVEQPTRYGHNLPQVITRFARRIDHLEPLLGATLRITEDAVLFYPHGRR